jgi:hypothetical protein
LGSLLDDLKVHGVGEDVLIWHNVMVDALVNVLASHIQRNLVPLLIDQNFIQDIVGIFVGLSKGYPQVR